jgi:acetyl-CoA acetyltransferase family protein
MAYIVHAVRTPAGRNNRTLANIHPADLAAITINALVQQTNIDANLVDDLILGCVCQTGPQAANIARQAVLGSVLPISVPGTTVDRQCGSGQQAIHFAAQAVISGTQDIVIAGGVESMSNVPIGSNVTDSMAKGRLPPNGTLIKQRFNTKAHFFSQFDGAEIIAKQYDVSRLDMEQLAVLSHKRAYKATKKGYFKREIIPVKGFDQKKKQEVVLDVDECIRWPTTTDALANLKPLKQDGRITAGVSSQIADGAAMVLICNEEGLRKLGLTPRAKIIQMSLAGTDPISMLSGPIPATKKALEKAGLSISDIDLYEVNEAFACVPIAWMKELKADINKLNVNGGAMALGHPLGATGAKLMTTLLHELERRRGRYGLLAICEGGGTANATIIECLHNSSRL